MTGGVAGPRVTVVGGGVVGLTSALRLAQAGASVRVVTADPVSATTSAVAAAIWSPFKVGPAEAALRWAMRSFDAFAALSAAGVPGVWMRSGRSLLRGGPDPAWLSRVPGARLTWPSAVPGVRAEAVGVIPVVDMGVYLPWLASQCASWGVVVSQAVVGSLAEVDGDVVVLAAGLRSGPFVDDTAAYPVRGQVVRLANPGLTEWLLDEQSETGLTYVVPRGNDVVCGGTADEGEWGTSLDPHIERAFLARCVDLVPALQGAAVLTRGIGLRPARPEVRLERVSVSGRPVVCCYGHGGAGVTLSWGCAADVAALALSAP